MQPQMGDIVRVKFGNLWHFGVFVSNDEVIQFGVAPTARLGVKDTDIAVLATTVDGFLNGGILEVGICQNDEANRRFAPTKTVSIARSRIGEKGYSLLHNNCEHFVNECVFGEHVSRQADTVRKMFASMPLVHLFWGRIPPNATATDDLFPPQRQQEILNCSHPKVRLQKHYVWKLLSIALMRSFGLKMADVSFEKTANGKWTCNKCHFSLSHSNNVVAVAVSKKPIGVDVELLATPKAEGLQHKILTETELQTYAELTTTEQQTEFLLTAWSAKESLFKRQGEGVFVPNKTPTESNVATRKLQVDGSDYVLTVANDDVVLLKLFDDVNLN